MKKVILILLSGILLSCSGNPSSPSADQIQAQQTAKSLKQANNQLGMPAIRNFTQKKDYKEILEILDQENMITYTYLCSEMTGKIGQFLGKSIGYGIPAATQYTNPMKYEDIHHTNGGSYGKFMPQADPNGLFMPTATSATWIKLIDPDGKPRVVYIEPLIIVSPFKLH